MRRATSGIPPPVTATTLSRSAVGWMTRGPPHPRAPRSILTALNCLSDMSVLLLSRHEHGGSERHAFAARDDLRDPLGDDALEQDHHEADDEVEERELGEREGRGAVLHELGDAGCNPEPDEELARIGMGEQTGDRVHEGHGRIVEGRLVLLLEEDT